jgi:hypothetical protein
MSPGKVKVGGQIRKRKKKKDKKNRKSCFFFFAGNFTDLFPLPGFRPFEILPVEFEFFRPIFENLGEIGNFFRNFLNFLKIYLQKIAEQAQNFTQSDPKIVLGNSTQSSRYKRKFKKARMIKRAPRTIVVLNKFFWIPLLVP